MFLYILMYSYSVDMLEIFQNDRSAGNDKNPCLVNIMLALFNYFSYENILYEIVVEF
jgi:hypothetical protein